jgi:hypothetical protein
MREHLERDTDDGLVDPHEAFAAMRQSAEDLQAWYDGGRAGPRPPGRVRPLDAGAPVTAAWSRLLYQRLYDPDGRPRSLRRRGEF